MRFSWVVLFVSFMLMSNIMYASYKGTTFDFSTNELQTNARSQNCASTYSSTQYCEYHYPEMFGLLGAQYDRCVSTMATLNPPYYYCITPDDYREAANSGTSWSEALGLMYEVMTVPYDNIYLSFINIIGYAVLGIFIYKAALPTASVD